MSSRIFLAAGSLLACLSLLLLGACDGHSWEDTQKQHEPHGAHGHGDHDHGDHGDDHAPDADH